MHERIAVHSEVTFAYNRTYGRLNTSILVISKRNQSSACASQDTDLI